MTNRDVDVWPCSECNNSQYLYEAWESEDRLKAENKRLRAVVEAAKEWRKAWDGTHPPLTFVGVENFRLAQEQLAKALSCWLQDAEAAGG